MDFDPSHPIWREINASTFVCLIEADSDVAFRGRVEIEILSGTVSIFGCNLDPNKGKTRVLATAAECAHTIKVLKVDENGPACSKRIRQSLKKFPECETDVQDIIELSKGRCVVLFQQFEDLTTARFEKHHPRIFCNKKQEKALIITTERNEIPFLHWIMPGQKSILELSPEWIQLANHVADLYLMRGSDLRILVTGGRNSGKSALIKYLINFLLNDYDGVYHMECDPGQPQFTQQGCLSLTEITEQILAPPLFSQKQPLACYFAGGINVSTLPGHYTECVTKIHNCYLQHLEKSPRPLFVNTMGHFKGIGVKLLFDIIAIVKPTHIIQLERGPTRVWNVPALTKEYLSASGNGWSNRILDDTLDYDLQLVQSLAFDTEPLYRAPVLRQLGLMAYFLQQQQDSSYMLFHEYTPYVVKWRDVALYCCNTSVPNHQIMHSLNGAVVAMCSCSNFQNLPTIDPSLPRFLNDMPDGEWFGYGIIRGIDMQKKLFYVITPTPKENLQFVNAFIKSSVLLPRKFIENQETDTVPPYMIKTIVKRRLIGTKALKRRTYRSRKNKKGR